MTATATRTAKKALGLDKSHNLGLDWQNYNFARAARFFVHFFAVVARP